VDPDNRRAVDFATRDAALRDDQPPPALAGHWRDGRVKQAVIRRTLALRRERLRHRAYLHSSPFFPKS